MPLVEPVLDNRTFDDLVAELRLRIPRFSKEYTNFNESDPGMTLVDLFAWLTEQTLFQLNQVPRKNYIKFLKLLGESAAAARPAKSRVTFVSVANNKGPVTVPAGFRITAQVNDGNPSLIFETDRGVGVIGSPLKAVGVYDGATLIPFTAANERPGTKFHPFGQRPAPGSALYLGFANPGENPFPQESTFFVFLPPEATAGKAQPSNAPLPQPPVNLVWEYRGPTDWVRMNIFADESLAFTREGYIRLERPAQIKAFKIDRLHEEELLWIRARIDGATYQAGRAPHIDIIRPNTVDAINFSTDRNRVLGTSIGHASEAFPLGRRPVEPESIVIQVGESTEPWIRKDDFLSSKKDDPHFVVDAGAGTIQFGDGKHGRIPPAGTVIMATQFRWGGGPRGNLATAGLIKDMTGSVTGIEKVSNERAATGGGEEQSLDEIIAEGPQYLRRRNRAVTPDDFASFAKDVNGVRNAVAGPCRHPDFPGVEVAGAVTVYIVPETSERPPNASAELIRSVAGVLNGVRLLTTEVFVASPAFTEIRVEARLQASPHVAFDAVAKAARQALDQLLDPQTWPFGKALHSTEIDRALLNVKDVVAILHRDIYVNGALQKSSFEAIPTEGGTLIYGAPHLLILTGGT